MKKILLTISLIAITYCSFAQSQVVTTGNNVVNVSNPMAADIVIGSNAGTRHDASIMWWSNISASRISNTADIFYLSQWSTATPNIALAATVGGASYFQGNLGVGTTSPTFGLLSIAAPDKNILSALSIRQNNSTGYGFDFGLDQQVDGGGYLYAVSANVKTSLMKFDRINNTVSFNGGNVGIGTTNPQNRLDVNGTVHSKQVNVDMNGWSDYVFKSDYSLPTLTEVKSYIDQNHHLPEIPSEQQIAKDGLNLGEMNKLLVKKVEELTLYLIEKDKQVNAQQAQINEMKQQIEAIAKQVNNGNHK